MRFIPTYLGLGYTRETLPRSARWVAQSNLWYSRSFVGGRMNSNWNALRFIRSCREFPIAVQIPGCKTRRIAGKTRTALALLNHSCVTCHAITIQILSVHRPHHASEVMVVSTGQFLSDLGGVQWFWNYNLHLSIYQAQAVNRISLVNSSSCTFVAQSGDSGLLCDKPSPPHHALYLAVSSCMGTPDLRGGGGSFKLLRSSIVRARNECPLKWVLYLSLGIKSQRYTSSL